MSERRWLVLAHRYVGLTLAAFLVVAGSTGALLAFYEELDGVFAPHLRHSTPLAAAAAMLDPFVLRERVERQLGAQARIDVVEFRRETGRAVRMHARAQGPAPLGYDEVFADPYTGAVQGWRLWGEPRWRADHLMSLVYRLHYALALPGPWGTWAMGLVALLWTLDCFVGACLTLPRGRPFLRKWTSAWRIKWGAALPRINFDLHRACSLWLWAMLLVFAWSAVAFNLEAEVYRPLMSRVFTFAELPEPPPAAPAGRAYLDWREAHRRAQAALDALARERSFAVAFEDSLILDRDAGVYDYYVHSSLDVHANGRTLVRIDARSGEALGHYLPTGHAGGDTVSQWLGALHMGDAFGLPYRIFVSVLGLTVAMLALTGVALWWLKRRGRRPAGAHQATVRRRAATGEGGGAASQG